MADKTFGVTMTFDSGFFAEITSLTPMGMSREGLDTSHHGLSLGSVMTGAAFKTMTPSDLVGVTEMTVEFWFNKDSVPPIDHAAETVTVSFPLQSGETVKGTWACSGFMTNYQPGEMPLEGIHAGTATLMFSGEPTITPAT